MIGERGWRNNKDLLTNIYDMVKMHMLAHQGEGGGGGPFSGRIWYISRTNAWDFK